MAETNEDKNSKQSQSDYLHSEVESLRAMLTRWFGLDKDTPDKKNDESADSKPKKKNL